MSNTNGKEREKKNSVLGFGGGGLLLLFVVIQIVVLFLNQKPLADTLADVPAYDGSPYAIINSNEPLFGEEDLTTNSYEFFSELDALGRCGYTMACVGKDLMPTEDRESISHVKPTGWVQAEYDWVDGKSLYNRCHLIGFQLTGENANKQNLITGTRYMNVEGMPWYNPDAAGKMQDVNDNINAKYSQEPIKLTGKETAAMIKGVMAAALLIVAIFIGVFALFILFCSNIWLV